VFPAALFPTPLLPRRTIRLDEGLAGVASSGQNQRKTKVNKLYMHLRITSAHDP